MKTAKFIYDCGSGIKEQCYEDNWRRKVAACCNDLGFRVLVAQTN